MFPIEARSAQPGMPGSRMLHPIHSAALMEGPSGVALHLHGADGAMIQVPLTIAALRETAALAGAAAATHAEMQADA